ncbi:YcgL domain-containing protein [Sansalvadorimonas verongulae]|uniref:YcgL domain-containing protein n=1 Tax=Sansalvadorimonas verongulae TaxID=2172824 RepID=UPI0018AD2675|nr:YcgL domain-containing protein [Sansalvadorimonas verongulae]MTI13644.1 YcgL domain-containing protein [Sansalvadorimonas verongulae]
MKVVVSVYKTKRREGLYLYIDKLKGLKSIPDELNTLMGEPAHVVDFILTPEKKLANADTDEVISKISSQGYYLQMSQAEDKDDYAITLPDELLCFNDPQ